MLLLLLGPLLLCHAGLLYATLLQWTPARVRVVLLCAGHAAAAAAADQGRCLQLCPTGCAQLHLLGYAVLRQGPHLLLLLQQQRRRPVSLLLHLLLLMHHYQQVLHLLCSLSCCVACSMYFGRWHILLSLCKSA
jgi:hypothetical protein